MTTENMSKPISQVVIERLDMMGKGSCKECLYCEEALAARVVGDASCTHFCAMQLTATRAKEEEDSEWFPEGCLERMQYPMYDTCVWELCDNGCCFSFMPQNGVEAPEPAEHRKYIDALVKLINDADLTELGFKPKSLDADTHIGFITANKLEVKTITVRWGVCPKCWARGEISSGLWLNVCKAHYCYCEEHQLYWCIGENIFSSWTHETQETWDKNKSLMDHAKEVQPMHIVPFALNVTIELEP